MSSLKKFFKIQNLLIFPEDLILLVLSYELQQHNLIFQITKQLEFETNKKVQKFYRKCLFFFVPSKLDFCHYVHKTQNEKGSRILYSIIISQSLHTKSSSFGRIQERLSDLFIFMLQTCDFYCFPGHFDSKSFTEIKIILRILNLTESQSKKLANQIHFHFGKDKIWSQNTFLLCFNKCKKEETTETAIQHYIYNVLKKDEFGAYYPHILGIAPKIFMNKNLRML